MTWEWTWEWTARPMNLNSAELLLNWPLCVDTPDGKWLFLSLSAMKTWPLSLSTVSRMLRCALDCCCCYGCIHSYTVWTWSECKATEEQHNTKCFFFVFFKFIKGGWLKFPCLPRKWGHICLLVMNLTFKPEIQNQDSLQVVWPGIKLKEPGLGPTLATTLSLSCLTMA